MSGKSVVSGVWVLWSVFGFYRTWFLRYCLINSNGVKTCCENLRERPVKYRCLNYLDTIDTNLTYDKKGEILGSPIDSQSDLKITLSSITLTWTMADKSGKFWTEIIFQILKSVSFMLLMKMISNPAMQIIPTF